ncbi:uncharacterized protein LOC118433855 isoform X1 [Folsomia candida]|uniref:uncharacterized protein LOC118433855 isoform X1 n=1 Tax=Folsomia candida TaxID=158441 RepID=UPI0016051806|nr:uncharacterized protein LOC118433855 isoform X1 [Folsomia candida]
MSKIIKPTMQRDIIHDKDALPILLHILPFLNLKLEEVDALKAIILTTQASLQLHNPQDEQHFQELRQLSHSLSNYFYRNFSQKYIEQLVQKCNSDPDSNYAKQLGKFSRRLESPYSLGTFQEKLTNYKLLLQSEDIEKLESEIFPSENQPLKNIPQRLKGVGQDNLEIYTALMSACDTIYATRDENNSDLQDLAQLFHSIDALQFTPNKKSLLALDGQHQIQRLLITLILSLFDKKLENLRNATRTEFENLSNVMAEILEKLLQLLNPLESVVMKEEIIHGFHAQLTKLCYGTIYLESQAASMMSSSEAVKLLREIFQEIDTVGKECLQRDHLLKKIDQVFVEKHDVVVNLFCKTYPKISENQEDLDAILNSLTETVNFDTITKETSSILCILLLLRENFSSYQIQNCEGDTNYNATNSSIRKIKKHIQKSVEIQPNLKNLGHTLLPILKKDSLAYLQLLETELNSLFTRKQLIVSGIVDSYVAKGRKFYTLWKKLDHDAPIFGGPLVHFISESDLQLENIEKRCKFPDMQATTLYRTSLAKYFQSGDFIHEIMPENYSKAGFEFFQNFDAFSNLLNTMEENMDVIKNRWFPNYVNILLELLLTVDQDSLSHESKVGMANICQRLESLRTTAKESPTVSQILLEMQKAVTNLSKEILLRQVCPDLVEKTEQDKIMFDLEKSEISVWLQYFPEHLPKLCSMYNDWESDRQTRHEFSEQELQLLRRARHCDKLKAIQKPNMENVLVTGNRYVALLDPQFSTPSWRGKYILFDSQEDKIMQRLGDLKYSDWGFIKETMSSISCTDWKPKFQEILLCHQFQKFVTLFTTVIMTNITQSNVHAENENAATAKIIQLLENFQNHYDISIIEDENLVNCVTSSFPKYSLDVNALIKFKYQFNRCLTLAQSRWYFST